MRTEEDVFWDGVIERIDFEIRSDELERAEQLLKAEDSAREQDQRKPVLRSVPREGLTRYGRKWKSIAAAVAVLSVPIAYAIYTGTRSIRDMTFEMAITILEDRTQTDKDRKLAIWRAGDHALGAIEELRRLKASPGELRRWAGLYLETMAMTLDLKDPPPPGSVDESMRSAIALLRNEEQPLNKRLPAMERIVDLGRSAMLAIQRMTVDENDAADSVATIRTKVLTGLRSAMSR